MLPIVYTLNISFLRPYKENTDNNEIGQGVTSIPTTSVIVISTVDMQSIMRKLIAKSVRTMLVSCQMFSSTSALRAKNA